MDKDRIPKRMLFGWLPQQRPVHDIKIEGRTEQGKIRSWGVRSEVGTR